jgi:hypothetical protein
MSTGALNTSLFQSSKKIQRKLSGANGEDRSILNIQQVRYELHTHSHVGLNKLWLPA